MLWLLAIAVGVLVGLGSGGSLSNLARLKFHWPWVLVAAVLIREVAVFTPLSSVDGAQYVYVLSLGAIILWTVWHLKRLPGVWLVSAGGLLNLVAVAANGGRMPVAPDLARAELGGALIRRGHIGQYTLMGPDTHLNPLGDWISLPVLPTAFSPGDLLIAAGVTLVIVLAMRRQPEPLPNPSAYSDLTPP